MNTVTTSFEQVLGDTGPAITLTLGIDGNVFVLNPGTDTATMNYLGPDGIVRTVALTIANAAAGILSRTWQSGDLPVAGNYQGQVILARSGDATFPQTFPNNGTHAIWPVFAAFGSGLTPGTPVAGAVYYPAQALGANPFPPGVSNYLYIDTAGNLHIAKTGSDLVLKPSANVYHVKAYGALGNGAADDTAAIRSAIAAAVAGNGGTVYLPNGTYALSGATQFDAFELGNAVTVTGESREGTILKWINNEGPGSGRMFYCVGSFGTIENLTLDGNKANQTVDEHRAGIFIDVGATEITVRNVRSQNHTGDGITIHAGSNILIDGCHCNTNDRGGIDLTGGGSTNHVIIQNCVVVNNAANQIHSEPPDNGLTNITVTGCYLDGGTSDTLDPTLTIAGVSPTQRSSGYTITNNWIDGGFYAVYADDCIFANNQVVSSGPSAACQIYRDCNNWVIANNHFELVAGSTSAAVVSISGVNAGGTPDSPTAILLAGNVIISGVSADGVAILDVHSCSVEGNTITGSAAADVVNGAAGVEIRVTVAGQPIDYVTVRNNNISFFFDSITFSGNGVGPQITYADVSHNMIHGISPIGMNGIKWDADGAHVVQKCTAIGNAFEGATGAWTEYPTCPVLIGGNYGDRGIYSLVGSPSGVITWEQAGAMAIRRDPATNAAVYILTAGGTWLSVSAS